MLLLLDIHGHAYARREEEEEEEKKKKRDRKRCGLVVGEKVLLFSLAPLSCSLKR